MKVRRPRRCAWTFNNVSPEGQTTVIKRGGKMKFFLDTANLNEIREANSWGILDGITTNPSLVEKEGKNFYRLIEEICKMVDGPVSAEVTATDTKAMIHEGEELSKIHSNVAVKIPFIKTGIAAIKALSEKG